jgi:dUTP pyrophosphatase
MKVKIFRENKDIQIPQYQTDFSAGMDLHSSENTVIKPRERIAVKSGVKVAIPEGYELQARPRSGLALRNGITLANSPGTIDSDFRGEIKSIMINHSDEPFEIKKGDRICQLVLKKVEKIEWHEVDNLDETERGEGGFGSTGV